MRKYFAKNASGLKSDILRHRAEEDNLNAFFSDLEGKEDDMSVACKSMFIENRSALRQSKAELVSKIGKTSA